MALEQERRENTTQEQDINLEESKVPKLTSHFEAMVHGSGDEEPSSTDDERKHDKEERNHEVKETREDETKDGEAHFVSIADKVAGIELKDTGAGARGSDVAWSTGKVNEEEADAKEANKDHDQAKEAETQEGHQGSVREEESKGPNLEEITNYRQTAQQNSIEAIRAAQQRYSKAKEAAAGYVGEKASAAKDMTLEAGKSAAGLAGKVAMNVKDRATAAGWGVTHYTTEKAVVATKATAEQVKGTKEYAEAAAGTVKDTVAEVGQKAIEFTEKQAGGVGDAAVSAGESMAEYTARKKMEAEKSLKAKKPEATDEGEAEGEGTGEEVNEAVGGLAGTSQGGGGRGVLGAIGETITEIAQTTAALVAGTGEASNKKSEHED